MSEAFESSVVLGAVERAASAIAANSEYLTSLDQAMGDGDMGITLGKIAETLLAYIKDTPCTDIGQYLMAAGMAANKAAPSTMGTLTATALMRMGKEVKGLTQLNAEDVVRMFNAANMGIQERGKAKLGDKTIVDALHPASLAFAEAVESGESVIQAAQKSLKAAEEGRDSVTPLRSRIGRASWVGERTEGRLDPGATAFCLVLKAIVG